MERREVEILFQFLIGRFVRGKKRLPYHTQELKDFFQDKGQPLDLSPFYLLEIRAISQETVRVGYSVKKDPHKNHGHIGCFYESVEIACSFSGSEKGSGLFPRFKREWLPRELWDNTIKKIG